MLGLSATIFVTDKCNLACEYCYEPAKEYKTVKREYISQFIELLYETDIYAERPTITLDFIGGEPLLEPELIDFALQCFFTEGQKRRHPWVKCGNFIAFATTNGTLFDNKQVQELLQKWPCLILGLSLDGDRQSHDENRKYPDGRGSYDVIMKNFAWWHKRYQQPFVKGTLSRNNLTRLEKMLRHQIELGLVKPWVNPVYEENWSKEDAKVYQEELQRFVEYLVAQKVELTTSIQGFSRITGDKRTENFYCGSGQHMVALGLDGNLYPCHRFATNTHKYVIGNVEHGLDIDKLEMLLASFQEFRCKSCTYNGYCPTCFASFYDINGGEFKSVKNYCEIFKVEQQIPVFYAQKVLEQSKSVIKWE